MAEHNKQSLLYSNMCGVCVNNSQHCDKKRGNTPILILDPHKSSCELLITYTIDGKVIPINDNNQDVIKDIEILRLNCKKLIKEKVSVKDDIWKRFIKEHTKESWSEELFNTYSNFYYHKQRKKVVYINTMPIATILHGFLVTMQKITNVLKYNYGQNSNDISYRW